MCGPLFSSSGLAVQVAQLGYDVGGAFQLSDLSYNGTYVRFTGDTEVVALRRGTCTLHGSGVIGLGTAPSDPTAPCVRFEVLRFSDTLRQPPAEI